MGKFYDITQPFGGPRMPFPLGVLLNNSSGADHIQIFGNNPDVGATPEDIWSPGGTMTWLTSPETFLIVSTDAADVSASTGARTVRVSGLDENYNKLQETVTMDGLTDVTTTGTYIHVYRLQVWTAGSGETNAGIITAISSSTSALNEQIEVGEGQGTSSLYTVPDGFRAYLSDFAFTAPKGDNVQVMLDISNDGRPFHVRYKLELFESPFALSLALGNLYPPKTRIKMSARKLAGAGSGSVSGFFSLILIPSQYFESMEG